MSDVSTSKGRTPMTHMTLIIVGDSQVKMGLIFD